MDQNHLLYWCAREAVHYYEEITHKHHKAGATHEEQIAHYEFVTGNSLTMLRYAALAAGRTWLADRLADYVYHRAVSKGLGGR